MEVVTFEQRPGTVKRTSDVTVRGRRRTVKTSTGRLRKRKDSHVGDTVRHRALTMAWSEDLAFPLSETGSH